MTEITKVEVIISILWEGPIHYDNNEHLDEKCLYLIYGTIGEGHELLYIGLSINDFYNVYTEEMESLIVYRGVVNQKRISLNEQVNRLKCARDILINVLGYPVGVHRDRAVGENMIQLVNDYSHEWLYHYLKPVYYWKDGLIYNTIRDVAKKFDKDSVYSGAFYGFCINHISFGIYDESESVKNRLPVIRFHKFDITITQKEKIEKSLNIQLASNDDYYFIRLGGLHQKNMGVFVKGIEILMEEIQEILSVIPEFLHLHKHI